MHFCERCQVNPAEVVAFGAMCVCEPCARELHAEAQAAYGGHATAGIEDISPFGVILPPLGIAEGLGIAPSTFGMSARRLADEWNKPSPVPTQPRAQIEAPPIMSLRRSGESDRDGFPFLKVIFVIGAVGAVALVGSALLRATKTAKYVREGAAEAVKRNPEILAAL